MNIRTIRMTDDPQERFKVKTWYSNVGVIQASLMTLAVLWTAVTYLDFPTERTGVMSGSAVQAEVAPSSFFLV